MMLFVVLIVCDVCSDYCCCWHLIFSFTVLLVVVEVVLVLGLLYPLLAADIASSSPVSYYYPPFKW